MPIAEAFEIGVTHFFKEELSGNYLRSNLGSTLEQSFLHDQVVDFLIAVAIKEMVLLESP